MKERREFPLPIIQFLIMASVIIVVMILILMMSLWGKGQQSQEEKMDVVELELVYAYQNAQWNGAVEQMVKEFNEAYPNIRITYQIHYENTVYENILNKLIARDQLGDIVQIKTPRAYVNSGILGTIPESVVHEIGVEHVYQIDDKIYGVGAVQTTNGIIYNKAIFDQYQLEEPKNYQEFLDLCVKLRRHGITPVGVGGSDLWHMEYWVNHFYRSDALSQNRNWMKECASGKESWMDEEITSMLTHLQEVFSQGRVDRDWLSTSDGSMAYMFSEGKFAMMYTSACTTEAVLRLNEDMEMGWFYVPNESGEVQVPEIHDAFWAVSSKCQEDSKKYEAAMTFLSFFYSQENYANVLKSITAFPTMEGECSYDMSEIQQQVVEDYDDNQAHYSGYIGDEDCPEGFEIMMLTIIQQMLKGDCTVAEAQSQIQEAWDKCLSEEVAP